MCDTPSPGPSTMATVRPEARWKKLVCSANYMAGTVNFGVTCT